MIKIDKCLVAAIATAGIFIQMCHAMPEPTISVEPLNISVSPGEEFTVNITVNPNGVGVGAAQYDLYFNSLLLNVIEQTQGPFLSQDGASTNVIRNIINNTIGKAEYGEFRTGVDYGVTNPGVVASITFEAVRGGVTDLKFDNVILSDPYGNQISSVMVNNGTCKVETPEQTPTPTPTSTPTQTPTSTPSSGGDDGGASVTPTPTSTPLPSGDDNSNGNGGAPIMPTQTPTETPTINPVLSPSPPPSVTTTISPTPTASTPLPLSEENNRLPGFEAAFAIIGSLAISYFMLKGKGGGDK